MTPGLRTAGSREEPGMFAVGFQQFRKQYSLVGERVVCVVMNDYFSPWFFVSIITMEECYSVLALTQAG